MALVWFDGFNDGPNGIALRYAVSGSVDMAVNPLTGRAVALEDATTLTRSSSFADATCVIGFAFRSNVAPSAGTYTLVSVMEGAAAHVTLKYDAETRTLRLYRGTSTLIGTGTVVLPEPDEAYLSWRYIELKVTVGDAGSAEVRVDNTVDISLPSTDTRNGGTGQPDAVQLGSAGSSSQTFCYDDMYVLDGTGTKSSYLGKYTTISPVTITGDGSFVDWTPSADTNSACVDEADENADSDYVESDTRGNLDTYTTTTTIGTPTAIHAVRITSVAKSDGPPLDLRNALIQGGVEYLGDTHTVSSVYATYSDTFEANPATLTNWTTFDVSTMLVGIEDGTGAFERYATSRPYPFTPLELMTLGVTLVDGEMRGQAFVEDASAASFAVSLVSGDLRNPILATSVTDGADFGASLVSGLLKTALLSASAPPESAALTVALVTGDLRVTLRSYTTAAPEKASLSIALVSGDLT